MTGRCIAGHNKMRYNDLIGLSEVDKIQTEKGMEYLMESRVEQAAERKMCGYNCAQAVMCTYCDLAGFDEETAKNLTQGFAVGMGGSMEATCGALIGAVKGQNTTVICKELKGITDGVVKRECIDCVRDAAQLLENELL